MEYNTEEYQRGGGKPITTSDGYKYFSNRKKSDCVYLKCVLFRNGCKGSAKLNTQINLVYPKSLHNHEVDAYNSEVFALKSRCRTSAKNSRDNLRDLFNDTTRADPSAHKVTYKECESLMFRARRTSQPIIPKSAIEFCDLLPTTNFALNLKATITLGDRIAVIFFSEKIHIMIGDISDIQFDGTFYGHTDNSHHDNSQRDNSQRTTRNTDNWHRDNWHHDNWHRDNWHHDNWHRDNSHLI